MSTPRLSGFSMPPEWAPHERTWMEFPSANTTFTVDDGWLDHCAARAAALAGKRALCYTNLGAGGWVAGGRVAGFATPMTGSALRGLQNTH